VGIAIFSPRESVGSPINHRRIAENFHASRLPAGSDLRSTRHRDFSKLKVMKTNYLTFSLALLFGLMSLLPVAKAVVPSPDGGYPGFTTAEGTNSLKNLTSGIANTIQQRVGIHSSPTAQATTILALVRELSYLITENKTRLLVWRHF